MMLKPLKGFLYILYCIYIHCTPDLNIHYTFATFLLVQKVAYHQQPSPFLPALRHSVVEMIEDTSEFVKHLCCRHVFFSPRHFPAGVERVGNREQISPDMQVAPDVGSSP